MPNWCYNDIVISGPDGDLKKFLDEAEGEVDENGTMVKSALSMERMLPPPADNKTEDWARWNWGTKWPMVVEVEYEQEGYVQLSCDTASKPPLKFFETISSKYPTLEFEITYVESANDLQGVEKYKGGKRI